MCFWRLGGDVIFECDHRGCREEYDSRTTDFRAALDRMKTDGWTAMRDSAGFAHFCPAHNPMMAYGEPK